MATNDRHASGNETDGNGKPADPATGPSKTSPSWDGIEELNNPLPRWWLWTFCATIVWAVGFWIAFPAWPLLSDFTPGLLGWSSRGNVASQIEELREQRAGMVARLDAATTEEILDNPEMLTFATAMARPIFGDNCAPCHGAGGAGSIGYPNLNDDVWLWGGTPGSIEETIRYGIRSAHESTRVGDMPAFGRDELLDRPQILAVADYVLTLSGQPVGGDADLETGRQVFADNCAMCHGDDGTGMRDFGAPNLTTGIWLFGGERDKLIDSIWNGRAAVMPAWEGRLDDTAIKALTVFVHTLGGGEPSGAGLPGSGE